MTETSRRPAEATAELLKLARGKPVTKKEIAHHMGWHPNTASSWVDEFTANGVLVQAPFEGAVGGRRPMVYTLAPCWRGPA